MTDFRGTAAAFSDKAIHRTAERLGVPLAAIRSIIEVESRGGFDAQGRPRILFERHYFHRLTRGRYSASYPDISHPRWGGYGRSSAQYDRLAKAVALDRDAALRSASWGAFQIMGDNHAAAGFGDIETFVAAMMEGEDRHLEAFASFVESQGIADSLRRRDWAAFARRYNGPAYRKNRYDTKLAAAFARHAQAKGLVTIGARGAVVRGVQALLGIPIDGRFGQQTRNTLLAWQRRHDLPETGEVTKPVWDKFFTAVES